MVAIRIGMLQVDRDVYKRQEHKTQKDFEEFRDKYLDENDKARVTKKYQAEYKACLLYTSDRVDHLYRVLLSRELIKLDKKQNRRLSLLKNQARKQI